MVTYGEAVLEHVYWFTVIFKAYDDRTEKQNQRINIVGGDNRPEFSVEEWGGVLWRFLTEERSAVTRPSLSHQLCRCRIIIWSPAILVRFSALSGIKRMEQRETHPRNGKQPYCISHYWPAGQLSLRWEGFSVYYRIFLVACWLLPTLIMILNVSRHCRMFPGGQKTKTHPLLRTSGENE